jgi:hypothetical protein
MDNPVETEAADEPRSETAAVEDHENVDMFRGDEADAPADTGRPEDES